MPFAVKKKIRRQTVPYYIILVLLVFFAVLCIMPFWYVIMSSFSDPQLVREGQFKLLPTGFSLQAYNMVFRDQRFFSGLKITVLRTLIGTSIAIAVQTSLAFVLSKQWLPGARTMTKVVVFTILFNGGIIPTFLTIQQLHLIDTIWALILPMVVNPWNVLLLISFFRALPMSLEESARLDGANDFYIFWRIAIPLSIPAVATILLFIAVRHWNEMMDGIIYINSSTMKPMQVYLVELVMRTQMQTMVEPTEQNITSVSIQTAVIFASSLPVIIIYPFLQRYFVKGIMVGAVKG